MNEITNDIVVPTMDMDSGEIAALMAKLHAEDANYGSDGEATQPEGAFVSEDGATVPVAIN